MENSRAFHEVMMMSATATNCKVRIVCQPRRMKARKNRKIGGGYVLLGFDNRLQLLNRMLRSPSHVFILDRKEMHFLPSSAVSSCRRLQNKHVTLEWNRLERNRFPLLTSLLQFFVVSIFSFSFTRRMCVRVCRRVCVASWLERGKNIIERTASS